MNMYFTFEIAFCLNLSNSGWTSFKAFEVLTMESTSTNFSFLLKISRVLKYSSLTYKNFVILNLLLSLQKRNEYCSQKVPLHQQLFLSSLVAQWCLQQILLTLILPPVKISQKEIFNQKKKKKYSRRL